MINEIRVEQFTVYFDLMRVVNYSDEVVTFGINPTTHQQGSSQYFWVTYEEGEKLRELGYVLRNALDELYHCLAVTLARNVNEYFGIQETKHMLDQLEAKFPDLLKEVLRHARYNVSLKFYSAC